MENQALRRRAEDIAHDRDRGAAELLAPTLLLLADALAEGREATEHVVRLICRGQPAMAPLWNACAAAVSDLTQPGRFSRVRAEVERAPAALVRVASAALADALGDNASPELLTISYSSSVVRVLGALAGTRRLRVTCGESRPRYEGRRMATDLLARGVEVTLTTDAALATRLAAAAAVVVGADSFSSEAWINKTGTRSLAAAASLAGVPSFVMCTRDKAASGAAGPGALLNGGPPGEVWPEAPAGLSVVNPYFEVIPAELATLFLMESGRISSAELGSICGRYAADISHLINTLGQ